MRKLSKASLFVISAPSGAGKTSLVRALVEELGDVKISISYTTRSKRPGEQEGVDYFFISKAHFRAMLKKGAFLEHATIYKCYYGTQKEWVLHQLKAGTDVFLEIDWQGARKIRQLCAPVLSVFVLPPSIEALLERLVKRRQDGTAMIEQRLALAQEEIAHYIEFDYIIVNDNFDQAVQSLIHIVNAKRLRRNVQERKLLELLAKISGKTIK